MNAPRTRAEAQAIADALRRWDSEEGLRRLLRLYTERGQSLSASLVRAELGRRVRERNLLPLGEMGLFEEVRP